MVETWERHMAAEFDLHDIEATMATMSPTPFVNHVPVKTGRLDAEAAHKVLDPGGQPSNTLISRQVRFPFLE